MSHNIDLERSDGIATVTLNRPDQRNAINYQGWLDLRRIVTDLAQDDNVRVVILTGKGEEAFSAGADIKEFDQYRNESTQAKTYASVFDGALDALSSLPKPTICLIKGYCIGGGCELSMAADVRIAAENSRFGIPVARLGILVGYHEMRRLVELVGPGNASYILLSGRQIEAQEALHIGLINKVIPKSKIDDYVYRFAQEMVPLAPLSQSRHKQILQTVLRNPSLVNLTPEEEHLPFSNFDSEDFQEGRRSFVERRPPVFRGK